MSWWTDKRYRMIQNNLRDIDAIMDVDRYVEQLKEFEANVCMVGCGGITSFYPSRLSFQKPSPYLQYDFFGKLVEKCHENGIRVIARFDFSKTHIQFLEEHPDWYSKSIEGNPILYNDTVATCVNGEYQQEFSMQILEEVIRNYPVDGVFFNMFGYQTRDYNNHYVGICQCENCKGEFKQFSNLELPIEENKDDATFIKYIEFKKHSTDRLLEKIYEKVKSLNPEVAVCTYSQYGVDLVRNESNSAVDRPLPFWLMASENNVQRIEGTYSDIFSSNCAINAVDIFYRFMGVSPYLNALRLYGSMAYGGNLDWCIIGGFETYPDTRNFAMVKEIFHFHKANEKYFNSLKSCAQYLLLYPSENEKDGHKEYQGIFKMLKESHIQFDVIDARETAILNEKIKQYTAVILPGISTLDNSTVEIIKQSKIIIIGSGLALKNQKENLEELFSLRLDRKLEKVRGSYLLSEPKTVFSSFHDKEWVYLDKDYYYMIPDAGNKNYLPLIEASMYGPPERCFGHVVTEKPSITVSPGRSIYFPWKIGELYYEQGYEEFKQILMDVLATDVGDKELIKVEAPPCVEVIVHQCSVNEYLIQLLNYSGFNGTTFYKPIPISNIMMKFNTLKPVMIQQLTTQGNKEIVYEDKISLSVEGLYAAILVTTSNDSNV